MKDNSTTSCETTSVQWAYFYVRAAMGLNFLCHGLIRWITGVAQFSEATSALFAESPLPMPLVKLFLSFLPSIEVVVGVVLLMGYRTRWALTIASFLMVSLMTGMCMIQKWNVVSEQMLYVLILSGLIAFYPHNTLSVDGFLHCRKNAN